MDLFWKLPFLQQQGIKIHLHCFNYGRGEQTILNQYCESVNYYQRKNDVISLVSRNPFIVATRENKLLEKVLLKDNHPILCEGIHSTAILKNKLFDNRRVVVRLHNVEHEYYQHLYKSAKNIFKKLFYWREKNLLKLFESFVAKSGRYLFSVTENDAETFRHKFNTNNISHLPLFIPDDWVCNSKVGGGDYCLYNGDLSVDVNQRAAIWLIENVASKIEDVEFFFAGKNPSNKLVQATNKYENIKVIVNPNDDEMKDLIANAHINILPSYSSSGIKLKLLNALYNGRLCLVNNDTIEGSGLDNLCLIANTQEEFINSIKALMLKAFTLDEIEKRRLVLIKKFNNQVNAELLIKYLFD